MSNEWFENCELPPVGTLCEYRVGNFWKPCEIKGDAFDYGERVVLAQVGDTAKLVTSKCKLRPIKTEREKAIEEMVKVLIRGNGSTLGDCAKNLYDAGYRKLED
jgi:hypothetical protein